MNFKLSCTGLLLVAMLLSNCGRKRFLARVPISEASTESLGPAPEIENQSTSVPIMVETLPEPPSTTAAEAPPNVALPPEQSAPQPKPSRTAEARKELKPSSPSAVESRPIAPTPPIQLLPQFSEGDKAAYQKRISDQLDTARALAKSLEESQLSQQQQPSLAAVLDFIRKSEDALKRGEFYQSLMLAQKANTLAASLARTP
jgi:hypothetical protein